MAFIEKITADLRSFFTIVATIVPPVLQFQTSSRSSREILHYVMHQCESFFIVFYYNVDGEDGHYNAL